MDETRPGPAWPDRQDDRAYGYVEQLTSRGWAWEFLRRNPDFQNHLTNALRDAERERQVRGHYQPAFEHC
ncbi:DUF6499 domain-containing protein [Mesorhizobium australicum]|uniref:transcriptional regulator domain-containing protein n=1 Tax=Mesorhizobium australicum TaxID=536018 RepID=UPI00333511E9